MAQPHSGDVCSRTAGSRRRLDANYAILPAISFRSLDTKLMKTFEVVLVHFRDDRSRLDFLQKGPKGFQHVYRLIIHLISRQDNSTANIP